MIKDIIFGTVGGLGLFLFGMEILSEGLKKIAGHRARKILSSLTKHKIVAVAMGAGVTCLIQSSSATSVMTIGFVNASLLTLKQALCVVLGANIGTTLTAWLVSGFAAFKITTYSMPAVGIGLALRMLAKSEQKRNLGQILLGFGILFVGIGFMKDAFAPLEESQRAQELLIWLGHNPILAVLAGTCITMLLQSSSASIMMIQILAFNGAFGTDWHAALNVALPFVLGDNIGTTITAQIASLQSSVAGRRTAWGHTLFNVIGTLYMLPIIWLGIFGAIVVWMTPFALSQKTIMVHIAVAHTSFNLFNTILFLPLIDWLERVVCRIVPARAEETIAQPVLLERHLLDTPEIAIDQARREIVRMTHSARKAVNQAFDGLVNDDQKKLKIARNTEDAIDDFQLEITSYLATLSRKELSDQLSVEIPVLLHTVNDLERIGDHAVNIVEIAERKIEQKILFSQSAHEEAASLKKEVNQMFEYIYTALDENQFDKAERALENEENLNRMQVDFRRSHVARMTSGRCSAEAGIIFIDLVDNMEKIGDHLTNIAQSVVGGLHWEGFEPKKPYRP